MGPEDLREVISTYQKCVTDTVQRFGGFVAKYMGDGVLVYFGYPQAQSSVRLQVTNCRRRAGRATNSSAARTWKAHGTAQQGCLFGLIGKASNAVERLTSGITAFRLTGSTSWMPTRLSYLAKAYADLDQFDEASRYIGEAMTAVETTKERWWEADIYRMAGEIALLSGEPDAVKAEAYFDRALAVARQQQARSWELRAAMSLARLWRDQGKVQQARELLAPVYGWFTEGFDTRDLKEAKACRRSWHRKGVRSSACDSVNQRQQ